jgi:hypothetical protein
MKKMKFYLTGLLIMIISAGLFSQTVDEIILQHIQAHGGQENWDAIQSMKITGMFTSFSEVNPFTDIKARGGKFYSSHQLGQHHVFQGSNGDIYWVDDPWFELGFPHIANEAEKHVIKQKAEFCTPFLNYRESGFEVELEGMENAEGREAYKLILTREDGKKETWWLDADSYLEVKSVSQWADFAGPAMQEVYYDDFRKVGDVVMPFYIERVFSIRNRMVEIENVELNIDPDPEIFELPLSQEMRKLKFMEGNWSVILESRGRSGQLVRSDSTTSKICFVPGKNLMEEKISYSNYFPLERWMRWSYNSDWNTYMMTAFNSFYSNSNIFTGGFSGDTLTVSNATVKINDEGKDMFSKYSVKNPDDDKMIIELEQSRDGGENWGLVQRYTYTRIEE